MNTDINLLYYGGSGGFFCLHLLLLTGQYNCVFHKNSTGINTIIEEHWNIKSIDTWKHTENWPDNHATEQSNLPNKVYFYCNPNKETVYLGHTNVLLYTDLETQIYLAETKKAHWFIDKNAIQISMFEEMLRESYRNIKDPAWPECDSHAEFKCLPSWIQKECIETDKEVFENNWLISTKSQPHDIELIRFKLQQENNHYMNGDRVFTKVKELADTTRVDISIKLQDLISTNGDALFSNLGISGNTDCERFVEKYLELHTPEQRKFLMPR